MNKAIIGILCIVSLKLFALSEDNYLRILSLANNGDVVFQYSLGKMFYLGDGTEQDYNQAFKWYKRASDQGYAKAQLALGNMYYYGIVVAKNYHKAFELYRKSTSQGNHEAKYKLANMYYYGKGVERNYKKAIKFYKQSADDKNPRAAFTIGYIYFYSFGDLTDNFKVVNYHQRSRENGPFDSEHSDLVNIIKSRKLAAKWIKQAAQNKQDRKVAIMAENFWRDHELWRY